MINTRQINVMSNQIMEQNARINELHKHLTLLGTQLQGTQIHISTVDARVPSFTTISSVLATIVAKVNELVIRVRVNEEEERILMEDLNAINMELAMGDLMREKGAKIAPCSCEWNTLCDACFH